ncbi:transmembrane protein 183A isoform X1 [Lates japonicus]|uniref:Transmembrane protein 183A isoform X1 n=1 Tax=Lates japonicus TaxID=270547 RepID=A0AAD3RLP0_LATJO|nr:transmembrane protein 183A isoform X1 [Lates japonicus]
MPKKGIRKRLKFRAGRLFGIRQQRNGCVFFFATVADYADADPAVVKSGRVKRLLQMKAYCLGQKRLGLRPEAFREFNFKFIKQSSLSTPAQTCATTAVFALVFQDSLAHRGKQKRGIRWDPGGVRSCIQCERLMDWWHYSIPVSTPRGVLLQQTTVPKNPTGLIASLPTNRKLYCDSANPDHV